MFESALVNRIEYSDPWNLEFDQRFSMLNSAPTRVAYFYEKPDTSTFRYRVFNMVQALNVGKSVSASWFHNEDIKRMHEVIDRVDALVFCRTKYTPAIAQLVARAKNRGVRVLYDVDDLVFNADYVHLVLDTLDQDVNFEPLLDNFFAYCSRNGALLRACDGAITTNEFLATQIKAFAPHATVGVVPNFLNREQQEVSEQLFARKEVTDFASQAPYHIGYFSGTPTHRRDFAVVSPAVTRLLEQYDDIRLVIVGFLEPGPSLERYRDRIDQYPLQDFLNLQHLIAQTEINIAPLIDNTFTNCKSELKFFEAAITGTISIATPTFTFKNSIIDGETGFLASSHEWESKLSQALTLLRNRSEYAKMAIAGFNYARQKYGWDQQSDVIEAALFGERVVSGTETRTLEAA
ncbi:glycosyltransferase [Paraburkholderia sp. RL17-383-BIF-A]|uniref:glycosyltransferase n=1 Tax=Paraburkholderia sp. RL17-383-BIF-A TaxID=3031631 RepID=UPI0038BC2C9D